MATYEVPSSGLGFRSRPRYDNPWAAEESLAHASASVLPGPEASASFNLTDVADAFDAVAWTRQRSLELLPHAQRQEHAQHLRQQLQTETQHHSGIVGRVAAGAPLASPASTCPIGNWRSSSESAPEDVTQSFSGGLARAHPPSYGGSHSASSSPPSSCTFKVTRVNGLREQLLRASSIPHPAPSGTASPPSGKDPRRKSLSSLGPAPPSEQLLQQQLTQRLEQEEQQWRQAEQEAASGQETISSEWFNPADAPASECLNWTEVNELCANMDIAGMRVEDIDICCPPPAATLGLAPEGVELVLMSLKFEGMTLRHYPGDYKAKELFSAVVGA